MAQTSVKKFPLSAKDYELYEEVGEGVSATVYRALCIPINEIVAIKAIDLEKYNNDLDGVRREVQTMTLIDHPNLLRAHCSFTTGHSLWVVMPFMAGGSCLHIMKSAFPEGFEEPVIATLLHEVLKALAYLHAHGHIHRDVKAGNILLDSKGAVKLADFGVSACMYDAGDRQRSRNTFAGTPCWMAPEVMHQLQGYDFKADIWSFGITALELAHGHAPFSKYPPSKVLLMTLQNAPPGLDYERDKRFSKSFKEMVAACLVKEPNKRPPSEKLLRHRFFKHARSNEYLERNILSGMSSLGERFRVLKEKEADTLVQNQSLCKDKEQLSQQEYIRGISAWNFDLEDLKNQATLIQDDLMSNSEDLIVSGKHTDSQEKLDPPNQSKSASQLEDEPNDKQDLENSLAAFPMKPLQPLKGCFHFCEDDIGAASPSSRGSVHSNPDQLSQRQSLAIVVDREAGRDDGGDFSQNGSPHTIVRVRRKLSSSSLLQDYILSPKKLGGDGDREHLHPRCQPERNYSGPLQYRQKKDFSNSNAGEDASEVAVVERRGRFKVTSAEQSPKGAPNYNPISGGSSSVTLSTQQTASFLPSMQYLLQLNSAQRDEMLKIIKCMEQSSGNSTELTEAGTNEIFQMTPCTRERELQAQLNQMQEKYGSLLEEFQTLKAKNSQLERELNELRKNGNKIRE